MTVRWITACLVVAAIPAMAQQPQQDPAVAMVLLGNCVYREAMLGGQMQRMTAEKAALEAYWAEYIGKMHVSNAAPIEGQNEWRNMMQGKADQ